MAIDYGLYLVTDSTPAILGEKRLQDVVEAAVEGGVTVVQYRDKHSDTADMIATARDLLKICQRHNVPLIINDRVDVALAAGAQGVHLGQTDMNPVNARRILGKNAIIGVTVSSPSQAMIAMEDGADYLGIGTVYTTATKKDTSSIIGISGLKMILAGLTAELPSVAIGGINAGNVQSVILKSQVADTALHGVAVVSAIVSATDPKASAQQLSRLIYHSIYHATEKPDQTKEVPALLEQVNVVIRDLQSKHPLCHNMTNLVVQNFAANVALAIGSSPIMANNAEEASELAALGGALVINMGSVTPEAISNYVKASQAYNARCRPVLFDPVGAGATRLRRGAVQTLLANCHFEAIKGNESEIRVLLNEVATQQRGVDSGDSTSSSVEKATLAKKLAEQERSVVVLTGKTDYISDGTRTYALSNGHEYLSHVTGTGCVLGTTIAACVAVHQEDPLLATLSGMLMFEIASERAGRREDVKGPGTFVPAFIDELYTIAKQAQHSDADLSAEAKVEAIDI